MDFELIFWIIVGIICLVIFLGCILPINYYYDPKGDDPYRYCPKEDEEE